MRRAALRVTVVGAGPVVQPLEVPAGLDEVPARARGRDQGFGGNRFVAAVLMFRPTGHRTSRRSVAITPKGGEYGITGEQEGADGGREQTRVGRDVAADGGAADGPGRGAGELAHGATQRLVSLTLAGLRPEP